MPLRTRSGTCTSNLAPRGRRKSTYDLLLNHFDFTGVYFLHRRVFCSSREGFFLWRRDAPLRWIPLEQGTDADDRCRPVKPASGTAAPIVEARFANHI